jgi:gustatory receptor
MLSAFNDNSNYISSSTPTTIGEKMDKKLINLCRAHDEICEIAKQVNRMFSIQMLLAMAYGFIFITAQFYFMYCGLLSQVCASLNSLEKN